MKVPQGWLQINGELKKEYLFLPLMDLRKVKKLEIMINPDYVPYLRPNETEPKLVAAFEGCFSIPLTTGIVNRYEAIMATYYNTEGKKIDALWKDGRPGCFNMKRII